jgi:hypothetical protein
MYHARPLCVLLVAVLEGLKEGVALIIHRSLLGVVGVQGEINQCMRRRCAGSILVSWPDLAALKPAPARGSHSSHLLLTLHVGLASTGLFRPAVMPVHSPPHWMRPVSGTSGDQILRLTLPCR